MEAGATWQGQLCAVSGYQESPGCHTDPRWGLRCCTPVFFFTSSSFPAVLAPTKGFPPSQLILQGQIFRHSFSRRGIRRNWGRGRRDGPGPTTFPKRERYHKSSAHSKIHLFLHFYPYKQVILEPYLPYYCYHCNSCNSCILYYYTSFADMMDVACGIPNTLKMENWLVAVLQLPVCGYWRELNSTIACNINFNRNPIIFEQRRLKK